ncbi:serine/threonine-protein kinase DCLK1-like isoform X2 [Stylophora pistillata]|uniref:serine/threonine-protein kinase DCLK1-like isoform X2 n=1 Tax=Stylophora pistillata TaxID=50429 RepID=UPI000C049D03|nr:serine/threonine-protein kinase DCLK1-like isoform X2 [Stylophora pistillata]
MENGMMNGDHDRSRSPSPGLVRSNSRNASSKEINRTSLLRRNQSLSAKQIRFYRNGDRFFCGLKLAVSPERYKEFDALLAELSNKLELSTGAVRYIFNAETGQMITDVNELQYGASYVCSSTNVFKEVDAGYGNMKPSWSLAHHKKEAPPTSSSVHLIDGTRDFIKPKLVTVIKNGKPPQKKVTMLLNAKTAINLEQVLDHLSSKGTLGKVDKLHTVDGKQIRELRHLFGDDTMFVALQSNEKFPDEGFDVDVQSYKITPYRDLKRPAGLKRSSSLRTPRGRRDSGSNDTVKSAGKERGMSPGPPARVNGHSPRATSAKSPNGSSGRRTPNSSYVHPNEELYPAHVFEKESPDSGTGKDPKKIKRERISVHGFYRIGKVIGDGNFAVVRECKSRKTNKEYALKIISKAKVKGKEHMVENEISILRRVKHKNIVELIEEYETPKEIFLVMELVKGGDLFEAIVKATKYTEKDASHMVRDLASALHYLHSMNVVHRDIKPENLLVVNYSDNRKSLKIADFGLATEVKSPMFLVCGTPTYVAPEILDETGYGLKVDIWAAGVITYILLCGFPPFRSLDQDELFDLILAGEFEYLSPFWDDISDSAKDLINHMLVVDDNKRFSALQVLNHSWIKGHTTGDKDIHSNLKTEITRNFDPRRRLRGAAIAVQTVNYFSKKTQSNSKKRSFQTDNQRLIESKKVVFSDEVLNLPSQPSTAHKLHHGSEGRLHFYENAWQNIESLTGGDLPYRHVSSPDIHSPVNKSQLEISDLVLNAMSEESVLPQQAKHGFGWSDNRQKPVSKTKHSPSLQDDSLSLHSDQNLHDSCEDNGVRQRKRSHSARVEHKDGTPIEKFGIPQITKTGSVNLWQFVERDLVLKPALIDENVVAPKGDSANHSPGSVSAEQTQDSSETKISDHSQKKNTGLVNLTEELKRLKMSLSEGANVAVEV